MNHPRCTFGGKKIGSGLPQFRAGNSLGDIASDAFFLQAQQRACQAFLSEIDVLIWEPSFQRPLIATGLGGNTAASNTLIRIGEKR